MKDSIVRRKSYSFALDIIRLYKDLVKKGEFVLSKQLLKSGTSIGANVEESVGAQSRSDFLSKISIAYKEARETGYWLNLLKDSGQLSSEEYVHMITQLEELLKLLGSIQKTTKLHGLRL